MRGGTCSSLSTIIYGIIMIVIAIIIVLYEMSRALYAHVPCYNLTTHQ